MADQCHLCKRYKWDSPQPVIYTDEKGRGYCKLHAPVNKKNMNAGISRQVTQLDRELFGNNVAILNQEDEFTQLVEDLITQAVETQKKECNLRGIIFPENYEYYINTDLSKIRLNFDHCQFHGTFLLNGENSPEILGISFRNTDFKKDANLINLNVINRIIINNSIFECACQFLNIDIEGGLFCYSSFFLKNAAFQLRLQNKAFYFENVEAYDAIHFQLHCSNSRTSFRGTKFFGIANFSLSQFDQEISFLSTDFNKGAIFSQTKFEDIVTFESTTSGDSIDFTNTRAKDSSIKIKGGSKELMRLLKFTNVETTFFDFQHCDWPKSFKLEEAGNHKKIEEFYRSLKRNALLEENQVMVSKWHYKEKEMALEQIKDNRGLLSFFSILWWYKQLSGFGERPAQAFLCLFFLILTPILLFGIPEIIKSGIHLHINWETVGKVFNKASNALPFSKGLTNSEGLSVYEKNILILLRIAITFQVTQLGIALRNQYRRH